MKKRIIRAVALSAIMISSAIPAFATSFESDAVLPSAENMQEKTMTVEETDYNESEEILPNNGIVVVNPYLRGSGKPTKAVTPPMSFGATITASRGGDLYTEKCFTNFVNGTVSVSASSANPRYGSITFTIFEEVWGFNNKIATFTVNAGKTKKINCTNFNMNNKYYIYFYGFGPFSFSGGVNS